MGKLKNYAMGLIDKIAQNESQWNYLNDIVLGGREGDLKEYLDWVSTENTAQACQELLTLVGEKITEFPL